MSIGLDLGRAIEPLLSGDRAIALRLSGDSKPLSEIISSVDSIAGRERVANYLASQPFPHYEPAQDFPGLLIRTEKSGLRMIGKFIDGEFCAAERKAKPASSKKTKRPLK